METKAHFSFLRASNSYSQLTPLKPKQSVLIKFQKLHPLQIKQPIIQEPGTNDKTTHSIPYIYSHTRINISIHDLWYHANEIKKINLALIQNGNPSEKTNFPVSTHDGIHNARLCPQICHLEKKKFSHLPQTLPRFLAHNNMRFFLSWSETLDYAFIRYFKTFFFSIDFKLR